MTRIATLEITGGVIRVLIADNPNLWDVGIDIVGSHDTATAKALCYVPPENRLAVRDAVFKRLAETGQFKWVIWERHDEDGVIRPRRYKL